METGLRGEKLSKLDKIESCPVLFLGKNRIELFPDCLCGFLLGFFQPPEQRTRRKFYFIEINVKTGRLIIIGLWRKPHQVGRLALAAHGVPVGLNIGLADLIKTGIDF